MTGSIQRRGTKSWRLKFEGDRDQAGNRKTEYRTVHGTKREAAIELTRLLAARDIGALVDPSKLTIADYLRSWIDTAGVSLKTLERYRQLIELQIIPHLGAVPLQKLKGAHIAAWHAKLIKEGGCGAPGKAPGRPLSPRTVGLDVVTVSRRLGHGSPAITLAVYSHLLGRPRAATRRRQSQDRQSGSRTFPSIEPNT